MKKGLTEMVFILDRSGSMAGMEESTIEGFNSLLAKQKEQSGEAIISTVLFDSHMEVLHDRLPIASVYPISEKEYQVGGCTALLDVVGATIRHIKEVRKNTNKEDRPEKTIFIITTDGLENSSSVYSYEKVCSMIQKRKKKHWEFLFLGANIDAVSEAAKIGIDKNRSVTYMCNSESVQNNYDVLSNTVSLARMAPSAPEMHHAIGDGWATEIVKDYQKRQKDGK